MGAAAQINAVPAEVPKFIAVPKVPGEKVKGVPVFLQPVVYLTQSYTSRQRGLAHIQYVTQDDNDPLGAAAFCAEVRKRQPQGEVFCLPYRPDLDAAPLPLRMDSVVPHSAF